VFPRNDHYRAREASLTVEARYDLIRTSPAGRTSSRPASRAEDPQAPGHRRRPARGGAAGAVGTGPAGPAAARPGRCGGSSGWDGLHRAAARAGVQLRPRMSERHPGQITGYAVALPDRYGTGTDDLVRRRQARPGPDPAAAAPPMARPRPARARGRSGQAGVGRAGPAAGRAAAPPVDRFGLTAQERQRLWQAAQDAATRARRRSAPRHGGGDPRRGRGMRRGRRRTCSPSSRNSPNDEAAARTPTRPAPSSTPPATPDTHRTLRTPPAGGSVPPAQRCPRSASPCPRRPGSCSNSPAARALADAVARLRQTQAHAAQAAAARSAAEQLRSLHPTPVTPAPFTRGEPGRPATVHGTTSTPPPPPSLTSRRRKEPGGGLAVH
jgi:hypothetical protein